MSDIKIPMDASAPVVVELDPETWDRGMQWDDVYLLGEKVPRLCCMGFAALAFGATEEQIKGAQSWGSSALAGTPLHEFERRKPGTCQALYCINDKGVRTNGSDGAVTESKNLSDAARVAALNEVCEEAGLGWRFALKGATEKGGE